MPRTIEKMATALECLKLANAGTGSSQCCDTHSIVGRAGAFYAFVTGDDTDDAKATLDAVREVLDPRPF